MMMMVLVSKQHKVTSYH